MLEQGLPLTLEEDAKPVWREATYYIRAYGVDTKKQKRETMNGYGEENGRRIPPGLPLLVYGCRAMMPKRNVSSEMTAEHVSGFLVLSQQPMRFSGLPPHHVDLYGTVRWSGPSAVGE